MEKQTLVKSPISALGEKSTLGDPPAKNISWELFQKLTFHASF
jgi:hypothetical protein